MLYDSILYFFTWILPVSCLIFAIIKNKEIKTRVWNLHQIEADFDVVRQPARAHHLVRLCGLAKCRPGCTLKNPMTVQRGYAFRGSTASACQGERYAADKAGAGTDLDRTAHPYQRYTCMRACHCMNYFVQHSRERLTWRTLAFGANHGGVMLWAKIVPLRKKFISWEWNNATQLGPFSDCPFVDTV